MVRAQLFQYHHQKNTCYPGARSRNDHALYFASFHALGSEQAVNMHQHQLPVCLEGRLYTSDPNIGLVPYKILSRLMLMAAYESVRASHPRTLSVAACAANARKRSKHWQPNNT